MWWTLLAAAVMMLGLVGVVIPVLPGLFIILGSAVGYGLVVGFGPLGLVVVSLHLVLVIASLVIGVLVPKREAERSGASKLSQLGGLVGAVLGFLFVPFVGVLVGALAGVVLVEYLSKGDWSAAWAATKGLARGFGKSALVDLGFAFMMLVAWSIWAFSVLV